MAQSCLKAAGCTGAGTKRTGMHHRHRSKPCFAAGLHMSGCRTPSGKASQRQTVPTQTRLPSEIRSRKSLSPGQLLGAQLRLVPPAAPCAVLLASLASLLHLLQQPPALHHSPIGRQMFAFRAPCTKADLCSARRSTEVISRCLRGLEAGEEPNQSAPAPCSLLDRMCPLTSSAFRAELQQPCV